MIEQFKNIAKLISEAGPKLDAAGRYGDDACMIETGVLIDVHGKPIARILGPYKNENDAHNYINVKRERHALSNAVYHGETGQAPDSDKTFMGHPEFTYRVVSADGYFAKYIAQIQMLCTTALMESFLVDDNHQPWVKPADDPEPGILDEDDPLYTRPCHECKVHTLEEDLNEMSECPKCEGGYKRVPIQ